MKKVLILLAIAFISSNCFSKAFFGVEGSFNLSAPVWYLKDEGYKAAPGFEAGVFYFDGKVFGGKLGLVYQLDRLELNENIRSMHTIALRGEVQTPVYYHIGNNYGVTWHRGKGLKKAVYFGGSLYTGFQYDWKNVVCLRVSARNDVSINKSPKFWHSTFSFTILETVNAKIMKIHEVGYTKSSVPLIITGYLATVGYSGLTSYLYSKRYPWPFDDNIEARNYIVPSITLEVRI